jgi:hypothetical protein
VSPPEPLSPTTGSTASRRPADDLDAVRVVALVRHVDRLPALVEAEVERRLWRRLDALTATGHSRADHGGEDDGGRRRQDHANNGTARLSATSRLNSACAVSARGETPSWPSNLLTATSRSALLDTALEAGARDRPAPPVAPRRRAD